MTTIAQAFNAITVAQGGTPKGGTIVDAIDALTDTLAGSDQPKPQTIAEAVTLLGEHIGGGGGGYGRVVNLALNTGDPSDLQMVPFGLLIGSGVDNPLVQIADSIPGGNIASGLHVTMLVGAPSSATFTAKTYWFDDGDHEVAFTDFTATYEADFDGWLVSFIMPEVFGNVDDNSSCLNFYCSSVYS